MRDAPVGVARRAGAGPADRGDRRRAWGTEPGGAAGARRDSRSSLAAAPTSRPTRSRARGSTTATCRACELPDRSAVRARLRAQPRGPRPRLPRGPAAGAARGARRPRRPRSRAGPGCWSLSKGLVPPLGTLPAAFASERCGRPRGRGARRPAHAPTECSSTAARSCSRRSTAGFAASSPTRCAPPGWTCRSART